MFSALEEKELAIVIDAMEVKEFKEGDTIMTQGDDGDVLYLIGEGVLDCTRVMVSQTLTYRKREKSHSSSRATRVVRLSVNLLSSITHLVQQPSSPKLTQPFTP